MHQHNVHQTAILRHDTQLEQLFFFLTGVRWRNACTKQGLIFVHIRPGYNLTISVVTVL